MTRNPWTRRASAVSAVSASVATLSLVLASCSGTVGTITQESPTAAPTSASGSAAPSATPAAVDPALAKFYAQKLAWRPCGGSFQCTDLTVPLDYALPAGGESNDGEKGKG